MKTWVKIVIAVCVILVICISVWAIFFKEKDEVQAYSRTSELIDYKQSLGLNERLTDLKDMNYLKNDSSKPIPSASNAGAEILEIRRVVLSDGLILGYGENQFHSYLTMEEELDEIIEYYLPYTRGDKVKTKSLNALKASIKDYIRALKKMNEKIDNVVGYQTAIEGSDVELEVLRGYYQQLKAQYRKTLTYETEVVINIMSYVDKSIYGDNFLIDTKSALFDAFTRAVNTSTSVDEKLESDYANDARIIMDRISDIEKDKSIFTAQYDEYSFLQSYNKLYNNYADTLNYVFDCKNLEKAQMSAGMSLGNVLENAQPSVINVLNVLGF